MAVAASPYLPFYTSSPSKPGEGFLFSRLNYCTDEVLNFDVGTLKPPKVSCCLFIKQQRDNQNSRSDETNVAESLRVAFAAGGTGCHISPAVTIADELKLTNPNSEFLFVGCPNSMESAAISSAGFDFVPIPSIPFPLFFLSPEILHLPYRLIKSIAKSYNLLRDFEPNIVIGTGGYVSFPICLAAVLKRTKLVIQEQNSVPGFASWVLSFFADLVFVAFNSTVDCFPRKNKCLVCGNLVRLAIRGKVPKGVARSSFFLWTEKMSSEEVKVMLVLGGSFGVSAINIAFLNLYQQMLLNRRNWFIIWQNGLEAFNETESPVLAYYGFGICCSRPCHFSSWSDDMFWFSVVRDKQHLIPSPNVEEGHQFRNASPMADVAGSRVITEDEFDSTTLASAIVEILGNEILMKEMSARALNAAKPDASSEIAKHILSLVT